MSFMSMSFMNMRFMLLLPIIFSLHAEQSVQQMSSEEKIDLFSEWIGYTLGTQLDMMKLNYNTDAIIRGIEKYKASEKLKSSGIQDEMAVVLEIQEEIFEKKAAENLLKTKQFFDDLANNPLMTKVIEKELYIEKMQEGEGAATIEMTSEPLLHYSAKTFEGIEIADTYSGNPLRIHILESIAGFSKGVQGMRVSEKRRIYVHPNLAYKRGGLVPPNSVLIFEVTVISL